MKTFYITIAALFLFCFNSCKDNSTNNTELKQFYPLSVGNYWKYQMISYDSIGHATTDSLLLEETVIGDTTLNGEKCYFLEQKRSTHFTFTAPYRNSSAGLIMQVDSTINKYPLIYKYPATINEMFGDSITVIAIDEMTTTVSGNFKCIVYQKIYVLNGIPGWVYFKTYVSYGIGKVKMELKYTLDKSNFSKREEYNLTSYGVQ